MEVVNLLTTGTVLGWFMILSLIAIALVLYIYHRGKEVEDEIERKYSMLGAVGGKAEKEEDEDLMDYEKLEEKRYPNDSEEEDDTRN